MRTKLGETHSRGCGAVDPRISSSQRKLSYTPDLPTQIGTPVMWIDPESLSMTFATEQPTFTDRMGNSWVKTATGTTRSLWQMPNGMNGRNCLRSTGPNDTDAATGATSMFCSLTLGTNLTAFFVLRPNTHFPSNKDGTAAIFARHQNSVADGANNFFWMYTNVQQCSFDRVDTGQVNSNITVPGGINIITTQSTIDLNAIWTNGIAGTTANPADTALVNPRVLYIGCGYPTSVVTYACHCDFGDIIMYNSILSAADRNAVEKYLGRKYGIAVA